MSALDTMKKEMFYCTCMSEGMLVCWWPEEEDPEISFSMWGQAPKQTNWQWRIEQAWNVLFKGQMTEDTLLLSRADALRLGNKLIDISFPVSVSA